MQILITAELIYFSKNVEEPQLLRTLVVFLENLISSIRSGAVYLDKLGVIIVSQLDLLEKIKKDKSVWDYSIKYSTGQALEVKVLDYSIEFCMSSITFLSFLMFRRQS